MASIQGEKRMMQKPISFGKTSFQDEWEAFKIVKQAYPDSFHVQGAYWILLRSMQREKATEEQTQLFVLILSNAAEIIRLRKELPRFRRGDFPPLPPPEKNPFKRFWKKLRSLPHDVLALPERPVRLEGENLSGPFFAIINITLHMSELCKTYQAYKPLRETKP